MAPNSKAPPAIMKQGTLSFASSKRGAAATASGKANVLKKTPSIGIVKPPAAEKKVVGSRTVSTDSSASALTVSSTSTLSDDDDVVVLSTAQRAPKRLRTASGASKPTSSTTKHAAINDSSSEDEAEPITPKGSLQVLEKSGQLNKLYGQAREKNNYLPLIHAEKQTNVHHILRVFDNSYEYGPTVGMTRFQRWQRAHALGLNPPPEILEILETKEASEDDSYKQSVFYDEL